MVQITKKAVHALWMPMLSTTLDLANARYGILVEEASDDFERREMKGVCPK